MVTVRNIALHLRCFNQKIILLQSLILTIDLNRQSSLFIQLCHSCLTVKLCKNLSHIIDLLAKTTSQRLKLWLKAIGCQLAHIISQLCFLHIQLVTDNIYIEVTELLAGFNIHLADRLSVLDIGGISAGTSDHDRLQYNLHISLKLRVNMCLIHLREVTQMYALRCTWINRAYQIAVNILSHKWDHWCSRFGDRNKCGIKSHISIDLILLHSLCPETLTAATYIPVTHLIHKLLQCSCCLRDTICSQIFIHSLNGTVQTGQKPFIHNRKLVII